VSERSRAAVIGPGRLGGLIAHALVASGVRLVHVAGGSVQAREQLCSQIVGLRSVELLAAPVGVDLIVIAVPDAAVATVVDDLARADTLDATHRVIHLAGVLGLAPLRRAVAAGARVAACHPALTAPAGSTDPQALIGTAWAVTSSPADRAWAHELVTRLGGDPFDVPEADRVRYHAALAMASNAVGAAVVSAARLLRVAGIADPGRLIGPIAGASVQAAVMAGAPALTGPIVRGDVQTVRLHLAALDQDMPELAEAYRAGAALVLAAVRPGLDATVAASLAALLGAPDARGD
jgi:predicted short-subunit dehydrogenase-like oxidoreductase (DUF2520 family)